MSIVKFQGKKKRLKPLVTWLGHIVLCLTNQTNFHLNELHRL